MKITTVKIENFMSIKHIVTSLDKTGMTLIVGKNLDNKSFDSNGAAKSALFEAVTWCLYGKLLRGDTSVNDIVREGQTVMTVAVTVDPEDATPPVTITRVRNKTKSTIEAVTNTGLPLFPADSSTDIQQYLDKWLGLDFKAFTNSVFFGKGLTRFFMVATDEERKDLLDTILQTVSFDEAHEHVKEAAAKNKEIINGCDSKIAVLTTLKEEKSKELDTKSKMFTLLKDINLSDIKSLKVQLDLSTKKLEELKKDKDLLVLQHKTVSDSLSKLIASLQSERNAEIRKQEAVYSEQVTALMRKKEQELIEIDNKVNSLKEKLVEKKSILQAKSIQVDALTKDFVQREAGINYGIRVGQASLENLKKNSKKQSCLECSQPISSTFFSAKIEETTCLLRSLSESKEALAKEILVFNDTLVKEQLALLKEIEEEESTFIKYSYSQKNKVTARYNDELAIVREKQVNNQKDLTSSYTKKIDDASFAVRATLEKIQSSINSLTQPILSVSQEIADITAAIKDKTTTINNHEHELAQLEKDSTSLAQKIIDNKKILKTEYAKKEKLDFWLEGFGPKGVRSFVLESTLPYLTERANYYSTFITGGTIKINISPTTVLKSGETREKLSVTAKNTYGAQNYYGNSDGERRRIDVCILLAIQDLVKSYSTREWNTLIFDEVFDTLDGAGIEHLIDMLRSLEKSIFLITHSAHIKKYFDTAMVITKKNGVSYLEE